MASSSEPTEIGEPSGALGLKSPGDWIPSIQSCRVNGYTGGVSGPVIGNGRGEDRPRPPAAGNGRTVGCLLVGGNTVVGGGMRVAGVVVVVGGRVIPGDVVIVGGVT